MTCQQNVLQSLQESNNNNDNVNDNKCKQKIDYQSQRDKSIEAVAFTFLIKTLFEKLSPLGLA